MSRTPTRQPVPAMTPVAPEALIAAVEVAAAVEMQAAPVVAANDPMSPNDSLQGAEPEQRSSTSIRTGLTVVAILLVIVFAAYWWEVKYGFGGGTSVDDAIAYLMNGDFEEAAANARTVMQKADPGSREALAARTVVQYSQFFNGGEEGARAAVQDAKLEYIASAGQREEQALLAIRILNYVLEAGRADVTREAFGGEPFQRLAVPGDTPASLRNLAQHSVSLYKTTEGLMALGLWHARELIRHTDGVALLSADDARAEAEALRALIAEAEILHETESQQRADRLMYELYEPEFQSKRGYLYASLALYEPSYAAQAQEAFALVEENFNAARVSNGQMHFLRQVRMPYVYLYQAMLAYGIGEDARAPDAIARLDTLMAMVNADRGVHMNFFVRNLADLAVADQAQMLITVPRVKALAGISPSFKTFLGQNGWEL